MIFPVILFAAIREVHRNNTPEMILSLFIFLIIFSDYFCSLNMTKVGGSGEKSGLYVALNKVQQLLQLSDN